MPRLLRWLFAPCCTRLAVIAAFIAGSVAATVTLWVGIAVCAGIGAVYGLAAGLMPRRNGKAAS